jgi:hypothetical protein
MITFTLRLWASSFSLTAARLAEATDEPHITKNTAGLLIFVTPLLQRNYIDVDVNLITQTPFL